MNNTKTSVLSSSARNNLYQTSNNEYGSVWVQNGVRPEHTNIKKDVIPSYAQIVESMNDFKKSERLIKSKIIQQKLQQEGIDPHSENSRFTKKTEFHIKDSSSYKYPQQGINVGPAIYRTNNMNYGSSRPQQFELQNKYYPTNNSFSKSFCGGNFKFDGLNTVKTVSNVHNALNQI